MLLLLLFLLLLHLLQLLLLMLLVFLLLLRLLVLLFLLLLILLLTILLLPLPSSDFSLCCYCAATTPDVATDVATIPAAAATPPAARLTHWDFSAFLLDRYTGGSSLSTLCLHLFHTSGRPTANTNILAITLHIELRADLWTLAANNPLVSVVTLGCCLAIWAYATLGKI